MVACSTIRGIHSARSGLSIAAIAVVNTCDVTGPSRKDDGGNGSLAASPARVET
jgi:hypothetical protein